MSQLQENQLFANRYRLVKKLGSGAFSEVWKAEDTKAGNLEVAIKIYAPDKGMDEDGIAIFSHEFSLVYNVNHQNLLKPSNFDDYNGSPFLVLPYCSKGSVLKMLGTNPSEQELVTLLRDVASGLAYLHSQNPPIIHQDIKPDNILITERGEYKLTDFGISTRIRSTLRRSVNDVSNAGTMAYMAPERFERNPAPIMASDIWSLGATLFELMTGDAPFGNFGGGMMINGAIVPEVGGNYSQELKLLVEKCLAKETWNRPTAEQLAKYADKVLNGENPKTPWQSEVQERTSSSQDSGRRTQRITSSPPQENDFGKTTQEQKIIGSLYTFSDGSKGIVFYLNSYGHGLAVSLDEEYLLWSKSDSDILNIPNESVFNKSLNMGLGATYTTYIINQLGSGNAPAADWCRVKGSEWYLPSAGELWQLLTVANEERGKSGPISEALKSNGGVSLYGCYWSSSEYSYFSAWNVYVRGGVDYYGKDNNYNRVRAVRAF